VATESVKILIEAEDKATAELQKAVREQEKAAAKSALIKQQQEQAIQAERIALEQGAEAAEAYRLTLQGLDAQTAALIAREKSLVQEQKAANAELAKQPGGLKSTKATTEFFGAVAGMAGGSQIASVAGQLAGLTEKTGQFAEVAKQGGASAMLFKAGLAAAAGAIGFQVGKAIGDVVFQTEKWKTELDQVINKAKELESIRLTKTQEQFKNFKIDQIELNPEGAEAAIEAETGKIHEQIKALEARKRAAEAGLAAMQGDTSLEIGNVFSSEGASEIGGYFQSFTGDHKAFLEQKKREVEEDKVQLKQLQDQKQELMNILGIEKERAEKRKQIAADQASESFVSGLRDQIASLNAELDGSKNAFDAMKNTSSEGSAIVAEGFLNEIEALKQQLIERQKLEQAAEQAAQKEEDRVKRINDLRTSELDRLKEQTIALEQGKEAAHRFRLEKQGLSADDAKFIAAEQARLDEMEAKKNQKETKKPELQASESRLLTRGPEQDQTAKNTAEISRLAKEQLDRLNKLVAKADKPVDKSQKLELVTR
jgi:hypothetical protein